MRKIARRDANHAEIVAEFRRLGCSVLDLACLGNDDPDLLVACAGMSALVEVKDGSKPPSQRKLSEGQLKFLATWKGDVQVVTRVEECKIVHDRLLSYAAAVRKSIDTIREAKNLDRRPTW